MKKLTFILALLLSTFSVTAQRVIEENIAYNQEELLIEVPFASEITLKTWNKPSIYIKADLSTEGNKYLDLYELEVKKAANKIEVLAKAEEMFKKFHEDYKKEHPGKDDQQDATITIDGDILIHDGLDYTFNYVIYVPEGADVKLSSINGNLHSELVEANLTADLINGNIEIGQYNGRLNLSTINGAISIALGSSDLEAETIHGNIYADEDMKLTVSNAVIGQQIQRMGGGSSSLKLNTINGNMYLKQ